jgi:hypothetical protein
LYLWHPWAGYIVQIHEVVDKTSGNVARCSRDGELAYRLLELPMWMFDRAACASMRMDSHPWVEVAALDALTKLLAAVAVTDAAPSNALVPGAQTVSCDENRGDHDAIGKDRKKPENFGSRSFTSQRLERFACLPRPNSHHVN